jgi:hypothetical protein
MKSCIERNGWEVSRNSAKGLQLLWRNRWKIESGSRTNMTAGAIKIRVQTDCDGERIQALFDGLKRLRDECDGLSSSECDDILQAMEKEKDDFELMEGENRELGA